MRDESLGGSHHRTEPDPSAGLRIATLAWRVRLAGLTLTVAYLMAGASTALLFLGAMGVASLVLAIGSGLARLEVHLHARRLERRR